MTVSGQKLDIIDAVIAFGLWTVITLWAFVWAHPYPHPDLWPFLATYGERIPLRVLSVVGKFALGAFAALAYLILRGTWMRFRDEEDDLPDGFFFTRIAPLCGAAIFALSPCAWRAAQFLSPSFALLVVALFAFFCWQQGCGYRHLTLTSVAYFLLAFVAGVHPLGWGALAYVIVCDALRRWQVEQDHGQREDDDVVRRRRVIERTVSVIALFVGLGCAIGAASAYFAGGARPEDLMAALLSWWKGYLATGVAVFGSLSVLMLLVGIGIAVVALPLGRRLRAYGPPAFFFAVTLTSVLGVVLAAFFVRAVDAEERMRLRIIRGYVLGVMKDAEGVDWLFTDGRFDDILRFEYNRRQASVRVMNALTPPTPTEAARLPTFAPEVGERELFVAGGSEVFKAWAMERPDRLAKAAWQVGTSVVRRFDKAKVRSCGWVMRTDSDATKAACDAADRRLKPLTRALLDYIEHPSATGSLFGSVDDAVAYRFDAVLWRAARMADERSVAAEAARQSSLAEAERQTMRALDAANGSLRAQGKVVERLMPTSNLVLTSRESLEVALKRADFLLAERFAHEVIASSPNDPKALFALGMAKLERDEHFGAVHYFERILKVMPDEPATLNNLALAYLKMGRLGEARACAERAAKLQPKSVPVQKNLADIEKAMKGRP